MVRAKFKLVRYETYMSNMWTGNDASGKQIYENKEVRTLILQPVVSNKDDENKQFFASTPTGEIKLGVVNQAAWEHFELNKEYYVDFTPAG